MTEFLTYYLITINLFAFFIYGLDKLKAKRGRWRISESFLLMWAVIGGSIGAWAGMKIWRHKTRHNKFKYGILAIMLFQVLLIIYINKNGNI